MSNRVKGIVVEIGGDTTSLSKAISAVSAEARDTQSELKKIEKLLKMDPTNITLLKQKQELLNQSIEKTEDVVKALKDAKDKADADMANGTEVNEKAYRELERQIEANEISLRNARQEADKVAKALNDINDDEIRDVAEAAEEVEDELQHLISEIATTQKELKEVDKLLDLRPDNIILLEQKQELLNLTIKDTEKALEHLEDAYNEMLGEAENGVAKDEKAMRDLERQIERMTIGLEDAREEANNIARALGNIDDDEIRDVAEAAEGVENSLEDAKKEAADFGDVLKAGMIAEAAGAIVDSLKDVAEETKEYRKIMGSLEVSSEDAGYSAQQTAQVYKQLYGVLADDQSAATATANLQAMHLKQDKLTQITNAAIGAWSRYGDSISIDSLAEAINHSAQLGEVQSSLADVLEWAGLSVEDFNAQLAECASTSERADLILQMMADQGLTAAGEKWQANNASLVEANEANADLQEQMAQLGETLEPLSTKLTNMVTMALEWFNSLDSGTQNFIIRTVLIVAALAPVMTAFSGVSGAVNNVITLLPSLQTAFSSVLGFIVANPIVAITAAVIAFVALVATKGDEIQAILQKADNFMQNVFAKDWTETFGPVLGGVMNAFMGALENRWNAGMKLFNGINDFIRGVFTGDWERAWQGVEQIFAGILDGILATVGLNTDDIKSKFDDAIEFVKGLLDFEWKWPHIPMPHFSLKGSFSLNPPSVPRLSVSWYAKGGILDGAQIFGALGNTLLGGGEAGPEAVLPLASFYKELRYVLEDILSSWPGMDALSILVDNPAARLLTGSSVSNSTTNLGGVNIAVYGAPGQDVRELAEIVMEEMQQVCDKKEAAFAT